MAASVERWADYDSDGSSSDESIIPHGRPLNSFTSYNSSAQKNKILIPASPASPGDGNHSDADVEIIKSDLPQPVAQHSLAEDANLEPSIATPPTGPRLANVEGKRTMSAAARERQSQIMKERWAAGRMSHVHEKIKEAKKRKASLQGLGYDDHDDDDERPPKRIAADRSTPLTAYTDTDGLSRSQLQLWEYIRPHLDVFKDKPIPRKCWVPDLLALPRVRDLRFNPRRSGKRPYVDTDDKKVAALILQLTGKKASQPCSRCLNGNGAFAECIKLSDDAFVGANIRNCANCWYSHQACAYETGPEDDQRTASKDDHRTAREADHIVVRDDSAQQLDSEVVDLPEISQRLSEETSSEEEESQLGVRTWPAIHSTLSGRRYNEWPDESGEMTVMKSSVLLPDEYKLITHSEKPWWCPVDECRRQFPTLRALGSHFPRVHYAQTLNDNLDGTFSVMGLYDDPKLGNGGAYPKEPPSFPYVAARKGKLARPPATRSKPSYGPGIARPPATKSKPSYGPEEEEDLEQQPSGPLSGDDTSRSMWQYIKPHLKRTMTIPDKGWVKELLPLPRVRDLRWNPDRRSDFIESHPRDISCMIIQVTGEEAPSPCTKCADGRGPFGGCVVIPRDAPPEVRARMVSCANCNYHNRQVDCSLINWVVNRQQPAWPGYLGKGGQPVLGVSESTPSASASASTPTLESSGPSDRRQSRRLPSNDEKPTASSHSAATPHAPAQTSGPAGDRNVKEITRPRPPPQREQSSVIPLGQPNPEEMLEMEDWEIAPGRIRFQASETQDDVALSRAYLTSNKSTQVHNDLAVRIDVISSGSTLRFEPMADKIRSCVVHSGKLRVKVDGEPEFTIGPLGQFKVPAGVACSAQNRLYIDSVLIVNTLNVYD
ncbi:hypothetical protein CONLIGDRAFT_681600 [Coniochaeta ligniaria NRRL 30616]|uniref:C2H2-type domain-containing protein n=1 Tax=Coniochaeta ligniaria NRRL 30616 TaxID=1408157 RepID=A0A1J7IM50_9PEZI|nr:hypothetical protein CONLIGDRAFT_681600 [Coniochaeta ligniaria NRRL 30616]